MRARSENGVFKEILSYSPEEIREKFEVQDNGSSYTFYEKADSKHYVSVDKEREDSFWVPVNADFGFARPAGSNNYEALINVARHMTKSFDLPLNW